MTLNYDTMSPAEEVEYLRKIAIIFRVLTQIFSLSLFLFCVIKCCSKDLPNNKRKRDRSLSLVSITDLEIMIISFSEVVGNSFYLVLFDKERLQKKMETHEMSLYDYVWATTQVFFELMTIISYGLLSMYSFITVIKTIKQTQKMVDNEIIEFKKLNKDTIIMKSHKRCKKRKNEEKKTVRKLIKDKTIKKIFLSLSIIIPTVMCLIPYSFDKSYIYTEVSLWPFLNGENFSSLFLYYDFVVFACIVSILQLVANIYGLAKINKLWKIFLVLQMKIHILKNPNKSNKILNHDYFPQDGSSGIFSSTDRNQSRHNEKDSHSLKIDNSSEKNTIRYNDNSNNIGLDVVYDETDFGKIANKNIDTNVINGLNIKCSFLKNDDSIRMECIESSVMGKCEENIYNKQKSNGFNDEFTIIDDAIEEYNNNKSMIECIEDDNNKNNISDKISSKDEPVNKENIGVALVLSETNINTTVKNSASNNILKSKKSISENLISKSSDYGCSRRNNKLVMIDADFEDCVKTITKKTINQKSKNRIVIAIIKNLCLTLGFAIEWWPCIITRVISSGNGSCTFTERLIFSFIAPFGSVMQSIFYFFRLGVFGVIAKKIKKNKTKIRAKK